MFKSVICGNVRKWWSTYLLVFCYGAFISLLNRPESIYGKNLFGWNYKEDVLIDFTIQIYPKDYKGPFKGDFINEIMIGYKKEADLILKWPFLYSASTGQIVGFIVLKACDDILLYIWHNPVHEDNTGFALYTANLHGGY